jgi:septum formation protein
VKKISPHAVSSELKTHSFYESTDVDMAELEHAVCEAYAETGESLDKAGAYGIQGLGSSLIKAIRGGLLTF